MGYMDLVASGLRYRKSQVFISFACISIAFLLLGVLVSAQQAFTASGSEASSHRLRSRGSSAVTAPIPLSYARKIASVPGTTAVLYVNAEPAAYQDDPRHLVLQAVSAADLFGTFPELKVADGQRSAFLSDKQSLLVGPDTLKRYGWHLGQAVTLQTNVLDAAGSASWVFHVNAIYGSDDPKVPRDLTFVHYGYFNDARVGGKDIVIGFVTSIAAPDQATRIASTIDQLFATSSPRIITQPENQAMENQLTQFGDFRKIAMIVAGLVFVSMLLLSHNVWHERVQMRRIELATMKALGFPPGSVSALIMTEALVLTFAGALSGVFVAVGLVTMLRAHVERFLPGFHFPLSGLGLAAATAIGFAVLSSLLPAYKAGGLPLRLNSRD
ncbi:ABC transporter permease [Dyella choica]|uniref:FtsX-like permease family protein n=1 Tax=Dyella choica TaxID=1927959 RepID=A0A3S0R0C1_9GAMM|nr:FtsX-like permease family protein [Dyella choica]RUL69174.1 FtsX-like permease family protein [Dyella choica]